MQRRLEGDWQIRQVFCTMVTYDFLEFLGARASKNVRNIGGALTSLDLSIFSKSRDTVPLKGASHEIEFVQMFWHSSVLSVRITEAFISFFAYILYSI